MAACLCLCMMLPSLAVRDLPYNRLRCWFKRTCCPCRCPRTCVRHNCFCLVFGKKFNIISALSVHQSLTLSQKNRFSRRFVLVQKGGSRACSQSEYLFKDIAINTRFWAFCGKMKCILVLNAVQNAAKCKTKSIKIHLNGINKTF